MSRLRRDICQLLCQLPGSILRAMEAASSGARVLIVHHEEQARRATQAVVNAAPGFDVVGEAASAEEALELAVALRPSFALVAAGMPGIDGFETSARLVAALPACTVVLLFTSVEPSEDKVAACQAVAALDEQALTPMWLRALWNERAAVS
jgi:chemotaxis response regulator CheB